MKSKTLWLNNFSGSREVYKNVDVEINNDNVRFVTSDNQIIKTHISNVVIFYD